MKPWTWIPGERLGVTSPFDADIRNSNSHFIVAGGEYQFSRIARLVRGRCAGAYGLRRSSAGRAGSVERLRRSFDDIGDVAEESYFRVGGRYGRNRTADVIGAYSPNDVQQLTLDQETATFSAWSTTS